MRVADFAEEPYRIAIVDDDSAVLDALHIRTAVSSLPQYLPTYRLAHSRRTRLVGRGAAVPLPGLRADASHARAYRDERRTEGIHAALKRARDSANSKDVRLGGGVATIQQYLQAGLVDEMHITIAPTVLGNGENLFSGLDLVRLGCRCTEHVATPNATHFVLTKASPFNRIDAAVPHSIISVGFRLKIDVCFDPLSGRIVQRCRVESNGHAASIAGIRVIRHIQTHNVTEPLGSNCIKEGQPT
jgi:riboflavin biosynthesis pyrimidine reductase